MKRRSILTPFGRAVKKRLIDLEWSQRELARRVGCSEDYIYQITIGMRSGDKYIERICRELDLPHHAEKGA